MTNLNLSPEAQTCFEQVQKAPENQKQSTFERACQLIKDKTQIATLALMLGLAAVWAPEAEAQEPQRTETTQANSVVNNPEYKRLLATIESEFNSYYQQWLKEINPSNKKDYDEAMFEIKDWLKTLDSMTPEMVSYLIESWVINETSSFYSNFTQYTNKFIPFIQTRTAERMATIAQNRETIAQLDRNIAENQRIAEWLTQLTATLKKLEDK